jgi:diacylglycerol kinase family enzyme
MLRAMKTVSLIVNPRASRVTPEAVRQVERELGRSARVTTTVTRGAGHAIELAARASAADAVVVLSGDGGFNEVLNGVDAGQPVGFIPGGGTSVLPRALGLPRDTRAAAVQVAGALRGARTRRISLGTVNGRRFAFNAGVGIAAEVVRRIDALGRAADGRRPADIHFAWTLLRIIAERRGRYDPELEIEGVGRAAFVLVANADPYTYMGRLPVRFAPAARFEAGLDVVAPQSLRAHHFPGLLGSAVLGRAAPPTNIRYLHDVEAIELRCDRPMPLQVDGEDLGDVLAARFAAERDAVSVLV